jgi:hypothetical protein
MDMEIVMESGERYSGGLDVAPGFPGRPLTDADHMQRFMDCIDAAPEWFARERVPQIVAFITRIEEEQDVRALVGLLSDSNRPRIDTHTGGTDR